METDLARATNTVVVSDIHLTDLEPPHKHNRLWKLFRRPEFFIDRAFSEFLEHVQAKASSPIELVLNGDIFDFDSVLAQPSGREFSVSWLEKVRGLRSEEPKSRFKFKQILDVHPVWVDALKNFVARGNRIVVVIGNHDIELHWPTVQSDLAERLGIAEDGRERSLIFVEWFYISNGDTLIEHGNQYDAYSLCMNPISPAIRMGGAVYLRLPFGNLAGKYMLNGMGLMNPHSESSYIKSSLIEYLIFFYKYVLTTQPLLVWSWFWSAMVTLFVTVTEGLKRSLSDPLTIGDRVERIAQKANATPQMVWGLRELHAHPACFSPIQTLRELWLDRALLILAGFIVVFLMYSVTNVFFHVPPLWFLIPLFGLIPPFILYARSVRSLVRASQEAAFLAIPSIARIARVNRVVHGHTHHAGHLHSGDVEYLNSGTWSPAFLDVECTQPVGHKCFVWIQPGAAGRVAELYEWKDSQAILIERKPVEISRQTDRRSRERSEMQA